MLHLVVKSLQSPLIERVSQSFFVLMTDVSAEYMTVVLCNALNLSLPVSL